MSRRKYHRQRVSEKPRMCDPSQCNCCQYIGEGDFICDDAPEGPVTVVEDWEPTENYMRCKHGRQL